MESSVPMRSMGEIARREREGGEFEVGVREEGEEGLKMGIRLGSQE